LLTIDLSNGVGGASSLNEGTAPTALLILK
jgi:hypothetical protein